MKTGCVCFMDALGSKGRWSALGHGPLLGRIQELAKAAQLQERDDFVDPSWYTVAAEHSTILRIKAISDTLVLLAWPKDQSSVSEHDALVDSLGRVLIAVGTILFRAAASSCVQKRFCYRGAISVGEFAVHENESGVFWLGPAVDDAAEWERCANGAFVILTPRAKSRIDRLQLSSKAAELLVSYKVPLKPNVVAGNTSDGTLETYCVKPTGMLTCDRSARDVKEQMLATFDWHQPGVKDKKLNTEHFLDHVLAHSPSLRPSTLRK